MFNYYELEKKLQEQQAEQRAKAREAEQQVQNDVIESEPVSAPTPAPQETVLAPEPVAEMPKQAPEPVMEQPKEPEPAPESRQPATDGSNGVQAGVMPSEPENVSTGLTEGQEKPEGTVAPTNVNSEDKAPESVTQVQPKEKPVLRPKQSSAKPSVKKRSVSKTNVVASDVFVKNFPRDLMASVKARVPAAHNNNEALAAYVYFTLGCNGDVSDRIKELASTIEGDHTLENMVTRMETMERQMNGISVVLQELEMALSFIIYDRLGWRRDTPKNARSIEFLDVRVMDVRDRMREQQQQLRKRDMIANGRPIK